MILWYSMISGHIMENPMENPIPRGPRFIWNTPHRRHGIWGTFWDQIPHVCPVCFSRMYDMDISRMRNDRGADSTDIGMRRRDIFLRFMDLWGLNILNFKPPTSLRFKHFKLKKPATRGGVFGLRLSQSHLHCWGAKIDSWDMTNRQRWLKTIVIAPPKRQNSNFLPI